MPDQEGAETIGRAVGETGPGRAAEAAAPKPRSDLDFTPVRNGMDYLVSAVKHLFPGGAHLDGASDLKYAVLHLQAAAEVLLKARLVREHWSLVFKDPAKATRKRYEDGGFDSCNTADTIGRLKGIAGVPITDRQADAIKKLAETRNALIHYGHTASAYAVEARAVKVLSFLIDFIPTHLQPTLSTETQLVHKTMETVRGTLWKIEALVKDRMKQLDDELQKHAEHTLFCPDCYQLALVVGQPTTCLFCRRTYDSDPEQAVVDWGYLALGDPEHDDSWCVQECHCGAGHTLIFPVMTAETTDDVALCFACRTVYREKEQEKTPQPHR